MATFAARLRSGILQDRGRAVRQRDRWADIRRDRERQPDFVISAHVINISDSIGSIVNAMRVLGRAASTFSSCGHAVYVRSQRPETTVNMRCSITATGARAPAGKATRNI
jgi:hypothetical protein